MGIDNRKTTKYDCCIVQMKSGEKYEYRNSWRTLPDSYTESSA